MKILYIVCGMKCELPELSGDVLGVDRGALYLAEKGIKMKAAMGDFDSVSAEEKKLIFDQVSETYTFNAIKDDTDLEAAIHYGEENGYDKLVVYGALGGRQDHNFVNIRLLSLAKTDVELRDEKHILKVYRKGSYTIEKEGFKYLSLFALRDTKLSISGVFYPLDDVVLKTTDIYAISNEILGESALLEIEDGELLVMKTND